MRRLLGAIALSAVLAGCSSGSSPAAPASAAPSGTASAADAASVETYLAAVNALCDALLPKVVAATHGGRFDVPAHEFLATWPAHKRLLEGFDRDLANIAVPAAASSEAATLVAYVRFAKRIDTARISAAQKGEAAYAKEVRAESDIANDPTIIALSAAGFNQSCTAR